MQIYILTDIWNIKKGDVKDMVTDAQKRAAAKYDKSHTKGVYIKLNKTTDADILERLQEVGNVQGYIKELIRKDILLRRNKWKNYTLRPH